MQLGSCAAGAVVRAGSCSSDSTPSLGTSICPGWGPKKQNKIKNKFKKKKRKGQEKVLRIFKKKPEGSKEMEVLKVHVRAGAKALRRGCSWVRKHQEGWHDQREQGQDMR